MVKDVCRPPNGSACWQRLAKFRFQRLTAKPKAGQIAKGKEGPKFLKALGESAPQRLGHPEVGGGGEDHLRDIGNAGIGARAESLISGVRPSEYF